MRTTSLVAAAFVAASCVLGEEGPKPKFYFPRHVKRQYSNATITTSAPTVPPSTLADSETSLTGRSTSATLTNLIETLTTTPFTKSVPSFTSSDTIAESNPVEESTSGSVTTIVREVTVIVPPGPTAGANSSSTSATAVEAVPTVSTSATTSPSTAGETTFTKSDSTSSSDSASDVSIPSESSSGATTSSESSSDATTSSESSSESSGAETLSPTAPSANATTPETTAGATTGVTTASDTVSTDGPVSVTSSADATTLPTTGTEPSDPIESSVILSTGGASTGSIPPTIVLPTTRASQTSSDLTASPSSSQAPPATNATIETSVATSDVISSVPVTTVSSSSGILIAPTGIVESSSSIDPLSSFISDITSALSSVFSPPTSQNATQTQDPTLITSSSTEQLVSTPTGPGTGIVSSTSESVTVPSSISTGGTGVSSAPTSVITSVIPPVSSNSTSSVPPITSGGSISISPNSTTSAVPSTEPGTITSDPVTSEPTSLPPIISTPSNNTSVGNSSIPFVAPITTSTPPTTLVDTTTTPPTTIGGETAPTGVTSIGIVSTYTATSEWLPSTVLLDPTTASASGGLAPTSAGGVPTGLPSAIAPGNQNDPVPEDSTLIQIGFLNGYNYPHVVNNNKAAAQIFSLLPQALAEAYDLTTDRIRTEKLVPLNTKSSLGYLTTLAFINYPASMVESLRMDIKLPNSKLYHSTNPLIFNFTQQINSGIDIKIGSYADDSGQIVGGDGSVKPANPGTPNTDPFNGGDAGNQSASQRGTTAGIATGAVCVAAAYGAAMFIIARRYKRKKLSHRRASSMSGSPSDMQQMSQGSPPLMGGALLSRDFSNYGGVAGGRDSHGSGRSGMNTSSRTAYISAPVAAENSLGWN